MIDTISTSQPLTKSIPITARVVAIYATAASPHTGKPLRVRVLYVRTIFDIDPRVTWKVADVRDIRPLSAIPFSVPIVELRDLKAFTTLEIQS